MTGVFKVITAPLRELKRLSIKLILFWPDSDFGSWLRFVYYKSHLKKIGSTVTIESGVLFGQPDSIEVGEHCIFGRNVNINSGGPFGVYIGNFVAIADGTYLRSENHAFDNLLIPIKEQGHDCKEIHFNSTSYSVIIEDDVWIGARVIILSGAHIGTGSVISAGSVVSNVIPPYSIVAGNPARVLKSRKL